MDCRHALRIPLPRAWGCVPAHAHEGFWSLGHQARSRRWSGAWAERDLPGRPIRRAVRHLPEE